MLPLQFKLPLATLLPGAGARGNSGSAWGIPCGTCCGNRAESRARCGRGVSAPRSAPSPAQQGAVARRCLGGPGRGRSRAGDCLPGFKEPPGRPAPAQLGRLGGRSGARLAVLQRRRVNLAGRARLRPRLGRPRAPWAVRSAGPPAELRRDFSGERTPSLPGDRPVGGLDLASGRPSSPSGLYRAAPGRG